MTISNFHAIDSALHLVDREIWIVTAAAGQRHGGLVATWVMQASLDPQAPLLAVGLAPNHYTTELVEAGGAFAAHMITREHIDHVWRFAIGSGRNRDKLDGIATRSAVTGAPVLADCLAWFDCRVVARYHAGDRTFFWGEALAGGQTGAGEPLVESSVIQTATDEQKAALAANRQTDIELQRPLRAAWRKEHFA